jgi:hypothetical protein
LLALATDYVIIKGLNWGYYELEAVAAKRPTHHMPIIRKAILIEKEQL